MALTLMVTVLGFLLMLSSIHAYHVVESCSGDLLWSSDEAYLFLDCGQLGYRTSYLLYPIEIAREYFGAVGQADDRRSSTIVFRITSSEVQRYENTLTFDLYTPFNGTVFANHDGELWKWSGHTFEQASSQEQAKLEGTKRLTGLDITDSMGWSKRTAILSRAEKEVEFPLQLGAKARTLLVRRGLEGQDISIDIRQDGGAVKRVWGIDQQPKTVNAIEYKRLFEKH
ncbi:MAG TPA: hypothetical protein VIL63_13990 [Terriglobales bacterium]